MASEDVTVRLEVRDQLSRPLREVRQEVNRTTTALSRMVRVDNGSTLGKLATGAGTFGRSLRNLEGPLRKVSDGLWTMTGRLARMAGYGLGAATAGLITFGIRAASTFEQTRIAMDGFLGSAAAGGEMFDWLKDLNRQTPFELGDVTGGARQLLGFGFAAQETKDIMGSVVDIASGLGGGADTLNRILLNLGQVRAAGVVTGRELRDLATLGFPGYELVAQILGKSREEVRAMGDDAQVSAEQFIAAVVAQQGALAKFAGQAEAQRNSLFGLWNNFKDAFTERLAEESSPLVQSLKAILPKATTLIGGFLDKIAPPLMALGGTLIEGFTKALPVIEPVLTALATGMGTLLEAMVPAFAALEPVGEELGLAIANLVDSLVPVMPELVRGFVGLVGILPAAVNLLAELVDLTAPLFGMAAAILEFQPTQNILGGVIAGLLGFKLLGPVIPTITRLTKALFGLGAAQAVAATGAKGGLLAKLAGTGGAAAVGGAMPLVAAAATGTGIGIMGANYALNNPDTALGRIGAATDIGMIGNGAVGRAMNGLFGRDVPARYEAPSRYVTPEQIRQDQIAYNNSISINVAPTSEIEFERAVRHILRDAERDRRERS